MTRAFISRIICTTKTTHACSRSDRPDRGQVHGLPFHKQKTNWLKLTLWESFQLGKLAKRSSDGLNSLLNVYRGNDHLVCPVPQVVCARTRGPIVRWPLEFARNFQSGTQRRRFTPSRVPHRMMIYISVAFAKSVPERATRRSRTRSKSLRRSERRYRTSRAR